MLYQNQKVYNTIGQVFQMALPMLGLGFIIYTKSIVWYLKQNTQQPHLKLIIGSEIRFVPQCGDIRLSWVPRMIGTQ
jgi:hypothetical protein